MAFIEQSRESVRQMRLIIEKLHADLPTAPDPKSLLEDHMQCGFYIHMFNALNSLVYAKIPKTDALYDELDRNCCELENNLAELAESIEIDLAELISMARSGSDYTYLAGNGFAHAFQDRSAAKRVAAIKPAECYE